MHIIFLIKFLNLRDCCGRDAAINGTDSWIGTGPRAEDKFRLMKSPPPRNTKAKRTGGSFIYKKRLYLLISTSHNNQDPICNWYAVKVYHNRTEVVCEKLKAMNLTIYTQSFVPSFVFLHCTEGQILKVKEKFKEWLFIYYNIEKTKPKVIPEKEMTTFILVTSNDFSNVMFLGEDKEEYHQGDRVRVKEGAFKGAEGYIKRIKRDRKLIVSINGIAAVALAYIPPQLLEKV